MDFSVPPYIVTLQPFTEWGLFYLRRIVYFTNPTEILILIAYVVYTCTVNNLTILKFNITQTLKMHLIGFINYIKYNTK